MISTRACWTVAALLVTFGAGTAIAQETVTACRALAVHDFAPAVGAATELTDATGIAADRDLPAYCRVTGRIAPEIGFEVRLPLAAWNGRFLMAGCAGLCGAIMAAGMEDALIRGYATATTDMGHSEDKYPDSGWAYNNPALETDFAHRATHLATRAAKAIIAAYFGEAPAYAYFRGCSTGGRQALVAARRYPGDYDGIIAGAPYHQSYSIPHFFWAVAANQRDDGEPILDQPAFDLLHAGALAACDQIDGLRDGVIGDPERCDFDPQSVRCEADASRSCLTAEQVEAARKIYAGARDSSGTPVYPSGPAPGSEFTWGRQLLGADGAPSFYRSVTQNFSQYLAYDPDPPLGSGPFEFDFDKDPARLAVTAEQMGFLPPQLERFEANGGRLLIYHGWVDESFPGSHTIDYWRRLLAEMGRERLDQFARLFMVPGMTHCGAGPGVTDIDFLSALERWVEAGEPPDVLIAHKNREAVSAFVRQTRFPLDPDLIEYSRPVYPYPDVAHYSGAADPADAGSYERVRREAR